MIVGYDDFADRGEFCILIVTMGVVNLGLRCR
jgi:hypothetical protein